MKTMKMIDIANKIENKEIKLPVTYKIKDLKHGIYDHIKFYDSKRAYWIQNNSSCIVTFDDLFREIELIEDKPKKIDEEHNFYDYVTYNNYKHEVDKVLYIIKAINKLEEKYSDIARILNYLLEKSDK